ncbi:MAG: helix-turn-helix domain containing protein [Nocardiopsaceae bacterium]|nr:helix-turn-helix domain containing protein [Nocardiopsaceae bacterium]
MTRLDHPATATGDAERDRRAERILDTASELLVAWGYRRVTIEEVARRSGVGKGTVYLHFHTKEVLFLTAVMRAQSVMTERLLQDMRADPARILPSSIARSIYLRIHEEPIIRAILTGDTDTLGTLSRTAPDHVGDLLEARERTLDTYFEVLREHDLVRTSPPVHLQRHALSAVLTGYLVIGPLTPYSTPDTETAADMLAHTVRSSFETGHHEDRLNEAVPRIIGLFQGLLERMNEEISRQKLT